MRVAVPSQAAFLYGPVVFETPKLNIQVGGSKFPLPPIACKMSGHVSNSGYLPGAHGKTVVSAEFTEGPQEDEQGIRIL